MEDRFGFCSERILLSGTRTSTFLLSQFSLPIYPHSHLILHSLLSTLSENVQYNCCYGSLVRRGTSFQNRDWATSSGCRRSWNQYHTLWCVCVRLPSSWRPLGSIQCVSTGLWPRDCWYRRQRWTISEGSRNRPTCRSWLVITLFLLLLFFLYLPSNNSNILSSLASSSYRMGESFTSRVFVQLFSFSSLSSLFFYSHRHTFTNIAISFSLSYFIFCLHSYLFVVVEGGMREVWHLRCRLSSSLWQVRDHLRRRKQGWLCREDTRQVPLCPCNPGWVEVWGCCPSPLWRCNRLRTSSEARTSFKDSWHCRPRRLGALGCEVC